MSQNFFAVLDDSGDEAPKSKGGNNKKSQPKKVAPAVQDTSKSDVRRRPQNYDRNTNKHGRGGRSAPRDGKRAYDRRSGTGRGHEIKKGGGGARNWGSDKNEARRYQGTKSNYRNYNKNSYDDEAKETELEAEKVEQQENSPEGDPAAATANEDGTTPEGEGDDAKEEEPPVEEEEDKTMTYAEYMAAKASEQQDQHQDREVDNEFAGKVAAVKKEEDFLVMGGGKQKKSKKKAAEKKSLKANFRVANSNSEGGYRGRGRGDRGGRGGGRGGRGRGRGGRGGRDYGGRGNNNRDVGIDVQDTSAFPSL